jgi:hypothetical protein
MGYMAELLKLSEAQQACWKNYVQVGTKMKGGREVPNCVPAGEVPKPKPQGKKTQKKSAVSPTETLVDVPVRCTPGLGCKRLLTDEERREVEAAKRQIIPDFLATEADPVSSRMSSPMWSGIGAGTLGGLLGSSLGAGVGRVSGLGTLPVGLAGALLGALGGGAYGSIARERSNKRLEAVMQSLPVGADIGDIELYSNPQFRQSLARDFQRQLIRKGLV